MSESAARTLRFSDVGLFIYVHTIGARPPDFFDETLEFYLGPKPTLAAADPGSSGPATPVF